MPVSIGRRPAPAKKGSGVSVRSPIGPAVFPSHKANQKGSPRRLRTAFQGKTPKLKGVTQVGKKQVATKTASKAVKMAKVRRVPRKVPADSKPSVTKRDLAVAVANKAVGVLPVAQSGKRAKRVVAQVTELVLGVLPKTLGITQLANCVEAVNAKAPPQAVIVPIGSIADAVAELNMSRVEALANALLTRTSVFSSQVWSLVSVFSGTRSPVAHPLWLLRGGRLCLHSASPMRGSSSTSPSCSVFGRSECVCWCLSWASLADLFGLAPVLDMSANARRSSCLGSWLE
jgi:hypothetical protein